MTEAELKYLESVYKDNYSLLLNYGVKIISDESIVKDIIQQVFLRICKRTNLKNINNPRAYLLRSLRNACYDYCSRKKDYISIEDLDFNIPYDDKVFNSIFAKDDANFKKWKSVIDSISKLSPRQKQILWLYHVKGLSHKEIAIMLDISTQSSMNTLSKAISKVRKLVSVAELNLFLALFLPFL